MYPGMYDDVRSCRILDRGSCDCTAEDLPYARLLAGIHAARYKSPLRACAPREACFLSSHLSVPPDYVNLLERPFSPRISTPLLPRRRVCALAIHRAMSHSTRACELSADIAASFSE